MAKDTLDEWIYFLKNEEIKPNFTAKGLKEAEQTLSILKLPEAERVEYENFQEDLRFQASMFNSSYGDGLYEGKIAGKVEGKAEGLVEGREEGQQQKSAEIARQLLNLFGDAKIATITGLSLSEVSALRSTSLS